MTVSTASNTVTYDGDDSTTSFTFSFFVQQTSDIAVYLYDGTITTPTETELTETTDYTVVLNADGSGTVTYPVSGSPLATNEKLTIARAPARTQNLDLKSTGPFNKKNVEEALDFVVYQTADAFERLGRSLRVMRGDTQVDMTVPAVTNRASKLAAYDATGKPEPGPSTAQVDLLISGGLNNFSVSDLNTVETYAQMTALTKADLNDRDRIFTLSNSSLGDGGNGFWEWRASSTSTADEGTILDHDEGGTGRFHRLYEGMKNLLWFGAVAGASDANGSTNDTAFVNAFSTSGDVFAPKGEYRVSDNIEINGSAKGFVGEKGTIVSPVASASSITAAEGVISIGDDAAASDITIRGIEIDGRRSVQSALAFSALSVREASGVWINDCYIHDGARDSAYFAGKALTGQDSDCNNIFMNRCHIGPAGRRSLSIVDSVDRGFFRSLVIDGSTNGSGIGVEPGTGKRKCSNIVVSGADINVCTGGIIVTSNANPCEDLTFENISIRGATSDGVNISKGFRVKLENIRVYSPGSDGFETGTVTANLSDITINDFYCESSTGRGMYIRAGTHYRINKPHLKSSGSVGIQVTSASSSEFPTDVRITGELIEDGTTTGLQIDEYATQVFAEGGHYENNGGDGVLISPLTNAAFVCAVEPDYVADNNGAGIRTNCPSSFTGKITISPTVSTNTASGNTQTYGVELDADSDYIILTGADLRGNGTGSLSGSVGANGVDANNIK